MKPRSIGVGLARLDELINLAQRGEVVPRLGRGWRQGATIWQLDTGDHVADGNEPAAWSIWLRHGELKNTEILKSPHDT